jgi:hypothetical protein
MASDFDLRSHLHKWGKSSAGALYTFARTCQPCADLLRPQRHQLGYFILEFLRMQLVRFGIPQASARFSYEVHLPWLRWFIRRL